MAATSAGLQSQPSTGTNIQLLTNQPGVIQNILPTQQQTYHGQPSTSAGQRVTYISRIPANEHHVVESTSVRMNYNLAPGWKRLLANGEIIYLR